MTGDVYAGRERLTFGYGPSSVPRRITTALPDETPVVVAMPKAAAPDWGFFGLLAFTAVLLLRPQDQIPPLSALHLAELTAAIGLGAMTFHRLSRGRALVRMTPEIAGLLAFGAVLLATAPFSIWPGGAISAFLEPYVKVIFVFVLMMNTLTTRKRFEQLTWLILLCCGYVALLALSKYARGLNLVEGERLDGPLRGLMGNPNDLAMNMVTFMPLAVTVALTPRYSSLKRFTAAGITAAMFAVTILTKSRSGALGLLVMLATLVLLGRKVRPGFAGITLVAALIALPFLPTSFWSRMSTIVDSREDRRLYTGSREARSNVMREGVNTFLEYPITGVGAGQFKNYNPPGRVERWRETHNSLIQVAAETGVFGLLAFAYLIYRAGYLAASNLRRLRPRRRPTDQGIDVLSASDRQVLYAASVGLAAGLVGWFVCSLFASVAYGWTFYYLLALICACHQIIPARATRITTRA